MGENYCGHVLCACCVLAADWIDRRCCREINRLVGQVVKVSALRAEDPRFESCLRQDFLGVESYQ